MADLDALLPSILPYAPSCPTVTAEAATREAAIEFCERTRCWRHVTDEIGVEIEDDQIAIPTPDDSDVFEIETARFEGRTLCPVAFSNLPVDDASGAPRSASTLPDSLIAQHGEAIARGALSRILFLPEQVFSNPSKAAIFRAGFDERMARFSTISLRGQHRAPIRTRPRFF